MTKNDLDTLCHGTADVLMKHNEMKDVAFGPLFYRDEGDHYRVTGIWYSFFLEGFMGNSFGHPLREAIDIKKEDLEKWETVKLA